MHNIASHEAGLGNVSAEELIKNYTSRMARKGAPARAVYDALKILPRNNPLSVLQLWIRGDSGPHPTKAPIPGFLGQSD